jgi:hypothetical protein
MRTEFELTEAGFRMRAEGQVRVRTLTNGAPPGNGRSLDLAGWNAAVLPRVVALLTAR